MLSHNIRHVDRPSLSRVTLRNATPTGTTSSVPPTRHQTITFVGGNINHRDKPPQYKVCCTNKPEFNNRQISGKERECVLCLTLYIRILLLLLLLLIAQPKPRPSELDSFRSTSLALSDQSIIRCLPLFNHTKIVSS